MGNKFDYIDKLIGVIERESQILREKYLFEESRIMFYSDKLIPDDLKVSSEKLVDFVKTSRVGHLEKLYWDRTTGELVGVYCYDWNTRKNYYEQYFIVEKEVDDKILEVMIEILENVLFRFAKRVAKEKLIDRLAEKQVEDWINEVGVRNE